MSTTDYPHLRKLLTDAGRGQWSALGQQNVDEAKREFTTLQHNQIQVNSKSAALENILQDVKTENWSALSMFRIKTAFRDFEELLKGVHLPQRTESNELPESPSPGGVSHIDRASKDYPVDELASMPPRKSGKEYPKEPNPKDKSEMEKTIKSQKMQIDEMVTRMSKMASQKLKSSNPNIADLSDDNRPTKIAEKFSDLYVNLWTDTFEEMSRHMSETDTIDNLLRIVKCAYKFCRDVADEQMKAMERSMQEIMLYPEKFHRPESLMNYKNSKPEAAALSIAATKSSYLAREYRRESAMASVSGISKIFNHERLPKLYKGNISPQIQQYAERCVELTWYMVVQNPPVEIYVLDKGHVDTDCFTFYTKRGTQVQYCVWPALQLHTNGSCFLKGVVQAK